MKTIKALKATIVPMERERAIAVSVVVLLGKDMLYLGGGDDAGGFFWRVEVALLVTSDYEHVQCR